MSRTILKHTRDLQTFKAIVCSNLSLPASGSRQIHLSAKVNLPRALCKVLHTDKDTKIETCTSRDNTQAQTAFSLKRHKATSTRSALQENDGMPNIPGSFDVNQQSYTSISRESDAGADDVFGDYSLAYSSKSTWELIRTSGFFMVCRFQYLTDNADQVRVRW